MTLKEQVDVLPAPSVAVYVTTVVPRLKTDPGALVLVKVPPAQLSDLVGAVQLTVAWQDAFAFTTIGDGGHPLITGGVLSWTITLKEHVDELPAPSVAV